MNQTHSDLEKPSGIQSHIIRIWKYRCSAIKPHQLRTNMSLHTIDPLEERSNIFEYTLASKRSSGQETNFTRLIKLKQVDYSPLCNALINRSQSFSDLRFLIQQANIIFQHFKILPGFIDSTPALNLNILLEKPKTI